LTGDLREMQKISASFKGRRPDNAGVSVLVPRRLRDPHDRPGHLIVEGTDSEPRGLL
jgi:hypothetical protein